jgi:hypothetical protein
MSTIKPIKQQIVRVENIDDVPEFPRGVGSVCAVGTSVPLRRAAIVLI